MLQTPFDSAESVCDALPAEEKTDALADLFKVLGDRTRIRLLYAMFSSERCVGALAEDVGMTVSAVSHQLSVLKLSRLVTCRRVGKTVYYALADDHVHRIVAQGMEHVEE